MPSPLEPTAIHPSGEVLDDLRACLTLTRPPLGGGNGDWSYGVPASYLRGLGDFGRSLEESCDGRFIGLRHAGRIQCCEIGHESPHPYF